MKFYIAILCLLIIPLRLSAEQLCDQSMSIVSSFPAPPDTPSSLIKSTDRLKSIPDKADIVLVGDSQLDNWDPHLERDFPNKRVWNFSVSGNKTQNVVWRLNQIDKTTISPKAVILMAGTNNLWISGATSCGIFYGITAIINDIKRIFIDAEIFVMPILPRGNDFQDYDDIRIEINKLISDNSKFIGYTAVEISDNDFTCGLYESNSLPMHSDLCAPKPAYQCFNYQKDNLHISNSGYINIRQHIKKVSTDKFGYDLFD